MIYGLGDEMSAMRRFRSFFIAVPVTVVVLTSSCAAEVRSPPVSASVISGDWVDATGGKISLREDRTFSALDVSWGVESGSCPDGESRGSWAFWKEGESKDFAFASENAKSGNSLALSFEGADQGECYITLNLIDDGASLCATDDIEIICSTESKFRRPD